jgi:hypothetical protein
MRMPFLVWIAVAGLAASSTAEPTQAPASVVTPPWDLAAGFALVRMEPGPSLDRTALPGWNVAFATFPLGRFGLAVEVARNGRTPAVGDALVPDTKVRLGQTSFLAGPAVRVIRARRLTTSFRALLGVARVTSELPSDLVQDGIVPGSLRSASASSRTGPSSPPPSDRTGTSESPTPGLSGSTPAFSSPVWATRRSSRRGSLLGWSSGQAADESADLCCRSWAAARRHQHCLNHERWPANG